MIKEFVKAWDKNKGTLEAWFRATNQGDLTYEAILRALIVKVINPEMMGRWNANRIHVIDDGAYQGCQLFVVPKDTYQPAPDEYFITDQFYGSCSGCDMLEGIRNYGGGVPSDEQVREYMLLALHLLQRCRHI